MTRRVFGKNGPTLADKNVGRDWRNGTGKKYPASGKREAERAAKRLATRKVPA